jgi:hypothetical protein
VHQLDAREPGEDLHVTLVSDGPLLVGQVWGHDLIAPDGFHDASFPEPRLAAPTCDASVNLLCLATGILIAPGYRFERPSPTTGP